MHLPTSALIAISVAIGIAISSKIIIGSLLIVIGVYFIFKISICIQERRFQKKGLQCIPNLPPSFPSGNLIDLTKGEETIPAKFVTIREELNNPHFVKFYVGPIPHVMITSSQAFKEIFITKRKNYVKGSVFVSVRKFIGDALFIAEGETWRVHRHTLNPAFKTENIKLIANEIFPPHASILVKKWNNYLSNQRNTVNLVDEMSCLTLDIIGEAAFGFNINSQLTEDFSQNILFTSLKRMIRESILLALPGISYTTYPRIFQKYTNVVDKLVYEIIANHKSGGSKETKTNLLKLMIESQQLTDKELRDETFGFVIAGYETTSSTLSYTITALSQHPHIKQKVFEELDTVLKGKVPDWDDVHNLPYLKAVLFEALRYYPTPNMLNRECVEDDEVLGYFIPKGTAVWFSPHIICRDPQLYPSPNEFLPERFLNLEKDPLATQFPVFGAGGRICIGKQFAQNEALIILAMIYQHFDVELEDNHFQFAKYGVTLTPKSGKIMAKIHPRLQPL